MPKADGVLFCGGGTGGHVLPGLAVAARLRQRGVHALRWIGDPHRLEARLVPQAGIPLLPFGLSRPRLRDPRWLLDATRQAFACLVELLRRPPQVVVALGGYAALLPGLLAPLLRRPLVVLEQNARPGRTNRLLARFARAVVTQFPEARASLPPGRAMLLGNPVRPIPSGPRGQSPTLRVLVVGGSLAARSLNDLVLRAAPLLARLPSLELVHIAGVEEQKRVSDGLKRLGVTAEVHGFVDDMPTLYRSIDLAVTRAGATTVSELCVAGIGAIYIPLPWAAEDHQTANAEAVERVGGALVMSQDQIDPERLAEMLGFLLCNRNRVAELGRSASRLGRPHAAGRVADLVQSLARRRVGERRAWRRSARRPCAGESEPRPGRRSPLPASLNNLREGATMISDLFRGRRIHLIGVGGAGVSALVPLLQEVGARVSGCDCAGSPITARLRAQGLSIDERHDPAHVQHADLVVHTAAIPADHPELQAARALGVQVMTRGRCLVELMRGTRTIAVAGSHGKTSTTWMTGHLLAESGCDPVVMVGGSVASLGGGARTGHGDVFVAETDESDGSFAGVEPVVAVLTNLDREHLRHYGGFSGLEDSFQAWLARVPAGGAVVVPSTGMSERVLRGCAASVIRCALEVGDYHASALELGPDGSRMRVHGLGRDLGEVLVPLPGQHMASNALMAIAAALQVHPTCDLSSLARCERVRRRFTVHGIGQGVRVVEDYGHHPTEIRATIEAARLGGGRVHVLFQPHRHTRTADCFPDFVSAFDRAGAVVLLPIYAASEPPIPGIDSRLLADSIRARRGDGLAVHYTADREEAIDLIAHEAEPGDTVLVLGAGDVGELAPALLRFFVPAGPANPRGRRTHP